MRTGETGFGALCLRLAASLGPARLWQGCRDRIFWLCLGAGCLGLAFDGQPIRDPTWFVLAPFLEELTWRALLQEDLEDWLAGVRHGRLLANLGISLLFALAHVLAAPGLLSALTFFPSLALGLVWTRHRSLPLCALLHLAYNTLFFL